MTVALLGVAGDGAAPLLLLPFSRRVGLHGAVGGLARANRPRRAAPARDGLRARRRRMDVRAADGGALLRPCLRRYDGRKAGAPAPDANGYLTTAIDSAQITAKQCRPRRSRALTTTSTCTGSTFFVGDGTHAPLRHRSVRRHEPPLGPPEPVHPSHRRAHVPQHPLPAPRGPTRRRLDVCLSLSPIGPIGTTGLLAAAGVAGGELVPPAERADRQHYPDVTSFGAYFMTAAGGDCSTAIGATSIGSSIQFYDGTITLLESSFGASPAYTLFFTLGDFIDTGDPTTANLGPRQRRRDRHRDDRRYRHPEGWGRRRACGLGVAPTKPPPSLRTSRRARTTFPSWTTRRRASYFPRRGWCLMRVRRSASTFSTCRRRRCRSRSATSPRRTRGW